MHKDYQKETYVEYHTGEQHKEVLLDAPHAYGEQQDLFTGSLVRSTVARTDCNAIIAQVSRTEADLNRVLSESNYDARKEYQQIVQRILSVHGLGTDGDDIRPGNKGFPVLHLGIHGMKDSHALDIEFGNRHGESCSTEVLSWLLAETYAWRAEHPELPAVRIGYNEKFVGDPSICFFRHGDAGEFQGYGSQFHTIQIEFSRTLREQYHDEIVDLLQRFTEGFREQDFS